METEVKKTYIYGRYCSCDDKIRYVGKTVQNVDKYIKSAAKNSLVNEIYRPVDCWMKKHQELGHQIKYVILEEVYGGWEEAETKWILFYMNDSLLNLTLGGEGSLGWNPSPETRSKMSMGKIGKSLSESHKRKLSEVGRGQKRTVEARANMSKAQKGKYVSEETREKLRQINLGKINGPMSNETKIKISLSNKGRTRSEETRIKISQAKKGVKIVKTPEHIEKIRQAKLGKPLSDEHKEKLRQAALRRRHV